MKYKIFCIFLIILVSGLCITQVTAKTYKTKPMKFKDDLTYSVKKYLGKGDYVALHYTSKYCHQYLSRNHFSIETYSSAGRDHTYSYKMTKAKIKFYKKTNNGKYKITTQTLKAHDGLIFKKLPGKWKPYSAVIYYKNK